MDEGVESKPYDLVWPCLTAAVEATIREWFHESSARSARGVTKLLRGARDFGEREPESPSHLRR